MSDNTVVPESHKDLLESTALADIATVGPDGAPQVNPVWFGWDGTLISFSQTKARQKYRNLQKDNRIALSIVDPQGKRLYSCAFSLAGTPNRLAVVIGSVQGPEPCIEQAQDKVRALTKEGHGLRPKSLVVMLVMQLAETMQAGDLTGRIDSRVSAA